LSCLTGNCHEQFLGEEVAVTPPPYPARLDSLRKKGLAAYLINNPLFCKIRKCLQG